MQQVVHARQAVGLTERLPEDPLRILAPQRACAAVGIRWPGEHAIFEGLFLRRREPGRRARRLAGTQRINPAVAVGVRPALHEAPAAFELVLDGLGLFAGDRQEHHAVAVALLGVLLASDALPELRQVVGLP